MRWVALLKPCPNSHAGWRLAQSTLDKLTPGKVLSSILMSASKQQLSKEVALKLGLMRE